MQSAVTRKRHLPWLACLLAATGGCESSPPVQEMSDARQAIDVARQAGAEAHAKLQLYEALQYLQDAERDLDVEEYASARRSALQAKSKAQEARALSETSQPR
jgi:Domain of unknown function (DUF4398)